MASRFLNPFVRIEVEQLPLGGELRPEAETKKQNFPLMECRCGKFRRTAQFPFVPAPVKGDACFDDGVPDIRIARQPQPEGH